LLLFVCENVVVVVQLRSHGGHLKESDRRCCGEKPQAACENVTDHVGKIELVLMKIKRSERNTDESIVRSTFLSQRRIQKSLMVVGSVLSDFVRIGSDRDLSWLVYCLDRTDERRKVHKKIM